MPIPHYPPNTVRALLDSDHVADVTRQVLTERLAAPSRQPVFFTASEYSLLETVCNRLIPQDDGTQIIEIWGGIDDRLAENKSNGWRYDTMPTDPDAYRRGLAGIDESARTLFQQPFQQLTTDQQDQILGLVQTGDAPGAIWQSMPSERFFEEMLAEAVENYYSHPLVQETIGYVGMADQPAWNRLGLNNLEDREPRPI
jgi:gluconate 2-dehydrogenase gamma chain